MQLRCIGFPNKRQADSSSHYVVVHTKTSALWPTTRQCNFKEDASSMTMLAPPKCSVIFLRIGQVSAILEHTEINDQKRNIEVKNA